MFPRPRAEVKFYGIALVLAPVLAVILCPMTTVLFAILNCLGGVSHHNFVCLCMHRLFNLLSIIRLHFSQPFLKIYEYILLWAKIVVNASVTLFYVHLARQVDTIAYVYMYMLFLLYQADWYDVIHTCTYLTHVL